MRSDRTQNNLVRRDETRSERETSSALVNAALGALSENRISRNKGRKLSRLSQRPRLKESAIIRAARKYALRYGRLPTQKSTEPVPGIRGATWCGINAAGAQGIRGLEKGRSLPKILEPLKREFASVLVKYRIRPLSPKDVLDAARVYIQRRGRPPSPTSTEKLPGFPKETWTAIRGAMAEGRRGFPKDLTFGELLAPLRDEFPEAFAHRIARPITEKQIFKAGKEFLKIHGRLPTAHSQEPVPGHPQETWMGLNRACHIGGRGLEAGGSLAKIFKPLREQHGPFPHSPIRLDDIMRAGLAFHRLHGRWPRANSPEAVPGLPDDNWNALNYALNRGLRGLPEGGSLVKLFGAA